MPYIVCEDCKKRYDYEKEEFCPRCGCFNQPVKTWGMDANGNVIRVDGVNERDHDHSFVHEEFHHEKDVRRAKGLDWQTSKRPVPPRVADVRPQTPPAPSASASQRTQRRSPLAVLFIVLGIIIFVNFLLPLLFLLLE